jgi:hypothetical protein
MTDGRNHMPGEDGELLPFTPRDLSRAIEEDTLLSPADIAEVMRFDEALHRIETGEAVDLDPREDPALVGLLSAAGGMRSAMEDVTETHAFRSFQHRSRAALIHQLEVDARPDTIVTWRRGRLFTGLAAAAASIALFGFTLGGGNLTIDGIRGTDPVAPNLTVTSTQSEMQRLAQALDDIQQRTQLGQPVPAPLLHSVVENAAALASAIETNPARFDRTSVAAFAETAQASQSVLSGVTPESGAEGALTAAQRAARDGVVVATRYLDGTDATATPTATATGETTPTAAPTATVEATPTAEATPAPESTATEGSQSEGGSGEATPQP